MESNPLWQYSQQCLLHVQSISDVFACLNPKCRGRFTITTTNARPLYRRLQLEDSPMLTTRSLILDDIIESLDVPESAYKAAEQRYRDLGDWLQDRTKAGSAPFSPHVFSQGSFRLGTATRP